MSEQFSKSKQKRMAMEKARKEVKKKKNLVAFWSITIPLLIVVLILCIVFIQKSKLGEYGKYLLDDGRIDIPVTEYASIDTTSMNFAKADLIPDESSIESDINSQLSAHQMLSEDDSLTITSGAKVKVAYSSTLNGESYASVTEEDGGFEMTIGNASLAAEVDEALIGQTKGKTVTIPVMYPDDYGVESLNGQTLTYIVTILGIYETPAFDDTFVQTYLSDEASTAEEYRQKLHDEYYAANLDSAIYDFIANNTVVKKQPEAYNNNAFKLMRSLNNQQFDYYKEMYSAYGIELNSVYEMYGYENKEDYEAQLRLDVEKDTTYQLGLQLIYEQAGLTNTAEEVKAYYLQEEGYDETTYNSLLDEFGLAYLANSALSHKVTNYLKETVAVQ